MSLRAGFSSCVRQVTEEPSAKTANSWGPTCCVRRRLLFTYYHCLYNFPPIIVSLNCFSYYYTSRSYSHTNNYVISNTLFDFRVVGNAQPAYLTR
jgi:hypothetical protein